jgi:two-component system, NarL family, response regulator DevR
LGETTILLADGQPLFMDAIAAAIGSQPDLRVVARSENGMQAAEDAQQRQPNVAIIDLDLPNGDGVRTTQLIRERVPECKVLVLAGGEDPDVLLRAIEAGAGGFVARSSQLRELIEAARTLRDGGMVIPPRLLPRLIALLLRRRREETNALPRVRSLTVRERQVLGLLADGADNDQIGRMLVISPETARTHVRNALAKLGVHSRLEAVAFMTRTGFLEDLRLSSLIGDSRSVRSSVIPSQS